MATPSYEALIRATVEKGSYVPCPKITFLVDKPKDLVCEICLVSELKFRSCVRELTDNTPTILPCGHIAGYRCLKEWLRTHTNCPFCRMELKYNACPHAITPRPVNKTNIHTIPKTIPEGGAITIQCKECRLKWREVYSELIMETHIKKFAEARKKYLESQDPSDLAKAWESKTMLEESYAVEFKDARVGEQQMYW